nr:putative reverse transcriptase domain-containing protein [Tanacetum cinerariifolium]
MPPRRSEGAELQYPFFVCDGSSFDEWRDYGVAGNDYEGPSIFDDDQFEDELEMGDDAFVLIGKEVASNSEILKAMFPLLENFLMQVEEFVSNSHIRKIMSTCAHPRGPLDLMSLHVSASVPKKVQDFVEGLPYHGDSSDDDLVENSRTNFVYPWGNDEGQSIEERALLFLDDQLVSELRFLIKMAPKRNNNIYDVYERIMAIIDGRLDQFVDQFANRMNDIMNPKRRGDRNSRRSEGEESENSFFEGDGSSLFVEREKWEDDRVTDDDYEEGPV